MIQQLLLVMNLMALRLFQLKIYKQKKVQNRYEIHVNQEILMKYKEEKQPKFNKKDNKLDNHLFVLFQIQYKDLQKEENLKNTLYKEREGLLDMLFEN